MGRVVDRFALLAVAGELATEAGITGWEPGEAECAARKCLDAWIQDRGHTANQEDADALEKCDDLSPVISTPALLNGRKMKRTGPLIWWGFAVSLKAITIRKRTPNITSYPVAGKRSAVRLIRLKLPAYVARRDGWIRMMESGSSAR